MEMVVMSETSMVSAFVGFMVRWDRKTKQQVNRQINKNRTKQNKLGPP